MAGSTSHRPQVEMTGWKMEAPDDSQIWLDGVDSAADSEGR